MVQESRNFNADHGDSGSKSKVHPWPKGDLLLKKGKRIEHYGRCLGWETWSGVGKEHGPGVFNLLCCIFLGFC